MDTEIFFHAIMTDAQNSKRNIAAKFQNALTVHLLPPIGVFWDIENCQVPKGKSSIALVQNIREKFFPNHREAEFMCVCDIHKESNNIIQELISAQVTVVHISATSKNAADDKLKQCMRRFVDTHGSPATLLLISDDVNFATDLSDFRHRHSIRIILLHRGHCHESLIACAHEHYDFTTVTDDLPSRSPVKNSENRPNELEVTNLPNHRRMNQIQIRLKRLSDNCGGKVLQVKDNRAVIRFANAEAAERAQKRMDKEFVFGNRISVNFLHRNISDYSPPRDSGHDFNSSYEASASSSSSRNSSISPPRQQSDMYKVNNKSGSSYRKQFTFPPPPKLDNQNFPMLSKQTTSSEDHMQNAGSGPDQRHNFSSTLNFYATAAATSEEKTFVSRNLFKSPVKNGNSNKDTSAFSPFNKDQDPNQRGRFPLRNVGRVSPFVSQDSSDIKPNRIAAPSLSNECVGRRNIPPFPDGNTNCFPLFANCNYSSVSQNMTSVAFCDIQRISDPVIYSSQWNGSSISRVEQSVSMARSANVIGPTDMSSSVELHVSNLDPNFEVNEMKKILQSVFREHVMVLHISMSLQPDGSAKATVKVPSLQDAQYAISQLHRRKIGHKRILISHTSADKSPPFHVLRSEAVELLSDIPARELPLIKFRELYEKRYHRPIAVSELYKMRDAVIIQGDLAGRIVYLNPDYNRVASLSDSTESQEFHILEKPYCESHYQVSDTEGWAEQYSVCPLPLVHISLKALSTAVHRLLDKHQGSLPLISFCACYKACIGALPIVKACESSSGKESISNGSGAAKMEKGVPLEHLIACIAGVEVVKSALCIKKVQWMENKNTESQVSRNFSPSLASQLVQFGREVMDLLKNQPQCLVLFNKFIPTYHHHFGRQCRVADYGFIKLIDLLEAMPHIVQVLGEGQNRQVTLTHRTQVKRFAAELLRILKSRASKQITLSEFSIAYEQCIEKPFDITNYGVCEIEDMLDEVSENTIVKSVADGETVIGIPRREQTTEEIERTKQFALEVVELLRHTPHCVMPFNKFIPTYHHHYGKQCRVADYGFSKLIELFEAVPDVLDVQGTGEDKILNLVEREQHKILSDRLIAILRLQPNQVINIDKLGETYARIHGHILRPSDFGADSMPELLDKLKSTLKIESGFGNYYLTMVDQGFIHQISLRMRRLLMEQFEGTLVLPTLIEMYKIRFGQNTDVASYMNDMTEIIQIENNVVKLTALQMLARDMMLLLQEQGPQISFPIFGSVFQKRFGFPICTARYGFNSMQSLFGALPEYFMVKGRKQKRVVSLNPYNTGSPLPSFYPHKGLHESSPEMRQKHIDILSQPIPKFEGFSIVETSVKEEVNNLMGFETPPIKNSDLTAATPSAFSHGTKREWTCKSEPKDTESSDDEETDFEDLPSRYAVYQSQLTPVMACSAVQTSPVVFYSNSPVSLQPPLLNDSAQDTPLSHVAMVHNPPNAQDVCTVISSSPGVDSLESSSLCFDRDRPSSETSKATGLPLRTVPETAGEPSVELENLQPSSHSTPTRGHNRRKRIAAQFSNAF